ncbi:solute carrier family 2, facilitated glucose transporter member 12-like [Glandiceps talaboti]
MDYQIDPDVAITNSCHGNAHVVDEQELDTVLLLSQTDDDLEEEQNGKAMDSLELEELQPVNHVSNHGNKDKMTGYVVLAAAMAAIGGIMFGYDIGIISGAQLQLRDEFQLSCLEEAIVVSGLLLGAMLGSIVGGFLVDAIGRRRVIIINAGLFVIGALTLSFSTTYLFLVIGRLIVGFAVSLSVIAECIYISEISPPKRRGSLVSLNELGISVGLLLAYMVNFLFISVHNGWRYMFGLSVIPAVIQGIGMFVVPTSPRYLMSKKKDQEARVVLQKIRGSSNIDDELLQIRMSIQTERDYSICDLFSSVDNMRGRMFIGIGVVFFQQVSGQTNVLYYAPTVFQMLGFQSNFAATLATVGLGTVKALATILCLLCVDKGGRRKFLLIGTISMTIVITVLGIATMILPSPLKTELCIEIPPTSYGNINITNEASTTQETLVFSPTTVDNNKLDLNVSHDVFRRSEETFFLDGNMKILKLYSEHSRDQSSQVKGHLQDTIQYLHHIQNIKRDVSEQTMNLSDSNLPINATDSGYHDNSPGAKAAKYLALASLMCYVAAYSLSFGPIAWILLSEIFPSGIRGRASAFATVFNWGTNLLISLTFLQLMDALGSSWTFISYGVICAISCVFVYFVVPETKNRSLEEVSAELNNSSFKKVKQRCMLLPCCRRRLQLQLYGRYTEIERRGNEDDRLRNLTSFDTLPNTTI